MPDRKSFVSTLWFTSLLALLAPVLVVPIGASGFVAVSSRPDCLRRKLVLPPSQPTTRLSTALARDAFLAVDALPSETEEQERADALDEPRGSFLIPSSFCKIPDRPLIATGLILSLYPLRC
jgi:hypothetical protein